MVLFYFSFIKNIKYFLNMFVDMLLIVEISNKNIMVKFFDIGFGVDDLLNSFFYF